VLLQSCPALHCPALSCPQLVLYLYRSLDRRADSFCPDAELDPVFKVWLPDCLGQGALLVVQNVAARLEKFFIAAGSLAVIERCLGRDVVSLSV
jgi:hypothetical protein